MSKLIRSIPRPLLFAAAAVLLVAAVAAVGFTGYHFWSDRQAEQGRAESVAVASRTVSGMFSYDFHTVDTDLPKVSDNLAPGLRTDFSKMMGEVAAAAKEKQLTAQLTAQAAGVETAAPSHAVVLLYVNAVATGKDTPQGSVAAYRVRVTLDKTHGRWLVSAVTPV